LLLPSTPPSLPVFSPPSRQNILHNTATTPATATTAAAKLPTHPLPPITTPGANVAAAPVALELDPVRVAPVFKPVAVGEEPVAEVTYVRVHEQDGSNEAVV